MADLRQALQRFVELAPAARPDFRDSLWTEIDVRQAAANRKRRVFGGAIAIAALAGVTAAGVFALGNSGPSVIDQTFSCAAVSFGGKNIIVAGATAWKTHSAGGVATGVETPDLQLAFGFDHSAHPLIRKLHVGSFCSRVKANVPLAISGLALRSSSSSVRAPVSLRCPVGAKILARVHVAFNAAGAPTSAQIAVRTSTGKPVMYIHVAPPRVFGYARPTCELGR